MVQGQVFLKVGGGTVKGAGIFPILIFSRFIIFTFRNYFTLCKIVYACEGKLFFPTTIILRKKSF